MAAHIFPMDYGDENHHFFFFFFHVNVHVEIAVKKLHKICGKTLYSDCDIKILIRWNNWFSTSQSAKIHRQDKAGYMKINQSLTHE